MIHCETERFILRELEETDAEGIFELDSNPAVHIYLGNKPIKTLQEAKDTIEHVRKQYRENGIGRWAIIAKENQEFIGWAGLKWITEPTNNKKHYFDIGYRLIERHWGKGIAYECATASLNYGFDKLNANEIIGMAHIENVASNNILQKIGLRYYDTFDYEGDSCFCYKMSREEWIKTLS